MSNCAKQHSIVAVRFNIIVRIVLFAFFVGCDASELPSVDPRGLQYDTPVIGVAHTDMEYAEDDYHFEGFRPSYEWYLAILINVRHDDARRDIDLLAKAVSDVKASKLGEVSRILREKGGVVKFASVYVFRDSPFESNKLGEFTSGIIIPLPDLIDQKKSAAAIFETIQPCEHPIVDDSRYQGWYHKMVIEHFKSRRE